MLRRSPQLVRRDISLWIDTCPITCMTPYIILSRTQPQLEINSRRTLDEKRREEILAFLADEEEDNQTSGPKAPPSLPDFDNIGDDLTPPLKLKKLKSEEEVEGKIGNTVRHRLFLIENEVGSYTHEMTCSSSCLKKKVNLFSQLGVRP